MKKVSLDFQYEINNTDEVHVEVNYRCWFTPTQAFYPMCVSGSIFKGHSLSDFKQDGKESYEKDYIKVEVVDVFIDLP